VEHYETITGAELYPASGASDDYSYEELGIPSVLTIEINGVGFVVSESTIQDEGPEVTAAIMHFMGRALDYYVGLNSSSSVPPPTPSTPDPSKSGDSASMSHCCTFVLVLFFIALNMMLSY